MAEDLKHSQPNEKQPTSRTEKPITAGEAAQILLSALDYCKRAGLTVTGYNENGNLRLSISKLQYCDGEIVPVTVKQKGG